MDYFGARYYAHGQYRFISADPIINKEGAISKPQLWNLYAFCRNNPITYLDPDGRVTFSLGIDLQYVSSQDIRKDTGGRTSGGYIKPEITVTPSIVKQNGGWAVRVDIRAGFRIRIPAKDDEIYQYRGLTGGPKSPEEALKHELGHLLINMNYIAEIYNTGELLESVKFPAEFGARIAAAGFKAESFAKMWGSNVLATFMYDLLKIPLVK
jgi:RHS repeat-associated protein